MKKRKICCFCQRWASGGIESFLHGLLMELPMDGLEFHLVAERLEESVFTKDLLERGVQFRSLSGELRRMGENSHLFRQLLRQEDYDVVYFNLFQGLGLRYAAIAKAEGVPVRIVHSHNSDLRKSHLRPIKLLLHRLGRALYWKDATHRCACCQAAGEFLFGGRTYQFVANGIHTEQFRFDAACRKRLRAQWGWEDCLVLGHVGRLCPQKNQMFLLHVFAKLLSLRPESRLILVGEGEARKSLETRAEALGIREQVCFYGASAQVEQLLCAMDVFLLPSLFEGLPVSGVEAQASGLPLLCSEGLSEELRLTESVQFLPLEAEAWTEVLSGMEQSDFGREKACEAVASAGFDIKETAAGLLNVFLGESP